jgi:hypothetical protein
MSRQFVFDDAVKQHFSEPTIKTLLIFPELLAREEGMLRGYHSHLPAVLFERSEDPLENLKLSARLILTMFLSKSIFYSRSIIDSANSKNLLVAFQSMRALLEVVAATRYTLEKLQPIIHDASTRGTITAEQVHQLNYQCDLLLHGGRFDWETFFTAGVEAMVDKQKRKRPKIERQEPAARSHYLHVNKCMESWAKSQPLAEFAYDYLCDLVHPNKGSNLVLIVERDSHAAFDVEGTAKLGMHIFDRIFPLVVRLCSDEFSKIFLAMASLGADDDQVPRSTQ